MSDKAHATRGVMLASFVFVVSASSTLYLSDKLATQFRETTQNNYALVGHQLAAYVQESIDLIVSELTAIQALYASSERVTRDEFAVFVNQLHKGKHNRAKSIEWAPLLVDEERQRFEESMRQYYPTFQIMERNDEHQHVVSKKKNVYFPISFLAGDGEEERFRGFDLYSDNMCREAMAFSGDTGKMAATAPIGLLDEQNASPTFLMFAPVHRMGHVADISVRWDKALLGFVVGVFDVNAIMEKAVTRANIEGLSLQLRDMGDLDGATLFGDKARDGSAQFTISIPYRRWQLNVSLNEALQQTLRHPPSATWALVIGGAVSFLLALCSYFLKRLKLGACRIRTLNQQIQSHNTNLESTVIERTEALELTNRQLNTHVKALKDRRRILTSVMEDTQLAMAKVEQKSIELERSNEDLNEFAYVASHDLKAPLRGIDQLACWIQEDLREGKIEEISEYSATIRQRIKRLESLLSDLLTYARVGYKHQKSANINSRKTVQDIFSLLSPPPEFQLSVNPELPIFYTDVTPFELIVRNLLGNAIKHHDRRDGHIYIDYSIEDDQYRFSVKDDGPGIHPEHHSRIFKMFKALKPRDEVEGSGMGLALVEKIVMLYGGTVSIESSVGAGCTFYFTWPKITASSTNACNENAEASFEYSS